jgi:hypothetical protein
MKIDATKKGITAINTIITSELSFSLMPEIVRITVIRTNCREKTKGKAKRLIWVAKAKSLAFKKLISSFLSGGSPPVTLPLT